jgi:hypothetical protein
MPKDSQHRQAKARAEEERAKRQKAFCKLARALIRVDIGKVASGERNHSIWQHARAAGFDLSGDADPYGVVKNYVLLYLGTRRQSLSPKRIRLFEELYTNLESRKPKDVIDSKLEALATDVNLQKAQSSPVPSLPGPDLPIIRLTRRKTGEYPPRNRIVLECHRHRDPLPILPPYASSSEDFLILDDTKISHVCAQNRSAMFIDDETGEVVAIVIRDIMESNFQAVQRSLVVQVTDWLKDASKEQHSKRAYGWSKESLRNPTSQNAETKDSQMASLFVFFFSLILGRCPWLAGQLQTAMQAIEIPGIDVLHGGQFTAPGGRLGIGTFRGKALAPPEGYVTRNLVEPIHKVNHWVSRSQDGEYISCPWAAGWTLLRDQMEGQVGAESGASFFISDYGLQILNSSNTFMAWKLSHWHGTGWSYNLLAQVGMVLRMSKMVQVELEEFVRKTKGGEIQVGEMPWNPR